MRMPKGVIVLTIVAGVINAAVFVGVIAVIAYAARWVVTP